MLSRGRSKQDFSCRGVTSVECPWRMCALGVVGWWPGDGPSVSVVRAVTQPGGNFAACALCARSRSDCEPLRIVNWWLDTTISSPIGVPLSCSSVVPTKAYPYHSLPVNKSLDPSLKISSLLLPTSLAAVFKTPRKEEYLLSVDPEAHVKPPIPNPKTHPHCPRTHSPASSSYSPSFASLFSPSP